MPAKGATYEGTGASTREQGFTRVARCEKKKRIGKKPSEIALKQISHARLDLTNQRYVYHEYEKRDRSLYPPRGETKVQVT